MQILHYPIISYHQLIDGLDRIREQARKRVAKYREKQKQLPCNVTCNDTVMESNAIEEEKEEDKNKNNKKKKKYLAIQFWIAKSIL